MIQMICGTLCEAGSVGRGNYITLADCLPPQSYATTEWICGQFGGRESMHIDDFLRLATTPAEEAMLRTSLWSVLFRRTAGISRSDCESLVDLYADSLGVARDHDRPVDYAGCRWISPAGRRRCLAMDDTEPTAGRLVGEAMSMAELLGPACLVGRLRLA